MAEAETPDLHLLEGFFEEAGIQVERGHLPYYETFFRVVSELTSYKISALGLLEAFDFVRELLRGKLPEIQAPVPDSERLRIQVRLFEELPQTRGRLDREEKLRLGYCFLRCLYRKAYDPVGEVFLPGAATFRDAAGTLELLDLERSAHPWFFALPESVPRRRSQPFGTSRDNPVQTTSRPAELDYLRRLRTKSGKRVRFQTEGCRENGFGQLVDRVVLRYPSGLLEQKVVLYFYGESYENSGEAPEGFLLRPHPGKGERGTRG